MRKDCKKKKKRNEMKDIRIVLPIKRINVGTIEIRVGNTWRGEERAQEESRGKDQS